MKKLGLLSLGFLFATCVGTAAAQEVTITFNDIEYSVSSFDFGEAITGIDVDSTTGHLFMVDA
jgi:hypothetical protein